MAAAAKSSGRIIVAWIPSKPWALIRGSSRIQPDRSGRPKNGIDTEFHFDAPTVKANNESHAALLFRAAARRLNELSINGQRHVVAHHALIASHPEIGPVHRGRGRHTHVRVETRHVHAERHLAKAGAARSKGTGDLPSLERNLVERVRSSGIRIPIVLVTSASTAELWWDALECCVDDILPAPLKASRLCQFLETHFAP
jgi:hypothetical protein